MKDKWSKMDYLLAIATLALAAYGLSIDVEKILSQ